MSTRIVSYDKGTPTAPRFLGPNQIAQDSWRGQPKTYVQDLEARTCSCPDFQHRKAGTGLLCKHLAALLSVPEAPIAAPPAESPEQREARLKALFG